MNLKQTAKELRWKASQLDMQAEQYRNVANDLEKLEGDPKVPSLLPSSSKAMKELQSSDSGPKKKRQLSAAARQKIAKAQKTRWRRWKKEKAKSNRKLGKVLSIRTA